METKPSDKFRPTIINPVCEVLGLKPEEVIIEPDPDVVQFLEFRKPNAIDFRCLYAPSEREDWKSLRVGINILNTHVLLKRDYPKPIFLEYVSLVIPSFNVDEKFHIKDHVEISEAGKGWLGFKSSFYYEKIVPGDRLQKGYLFCAKPPFCTSWEDFIKFIKKTEEKILRLEFTYLFDCVEIVTKLAISCDEMKDFAHKGHGNEYQFPRYIQPSVLDMEVEAK